MIALVLSLWMGAAPAVPVELVKQVDVPAPAAEVWKAWTTNAGVQSFFAPGSNVSLEIGGPYEILFDPSAPPGGKGAEGIKVLSFLPERMLSFQWDAPPKLPALRGKKETWIVLELTPTDAKHTRVTLHHLGWKAGPDLQAHYAYFDRAWGVVLGRLKQRFEKGPVDWKAQ